MLGSRLFVVVVVIVVCTVCRVVFVCLFNKRARYTIKTLALTHRHTASVREREREKGAKERGAERAENRSTYATPAVG